MKKCKHGQVTYIVGWIDGAIPHVCNDCGKSWEVERMRKHKGEVMQDIYKRKTDS